MTRLLKKTAAFIAIFFSVSFAFAIRTNFSGLTNKVCIDLPEGFKLESAAGENSFQLQSTIAPVHAIIQIYGKGKFKNTEDTLKTSISKLKLTADCGTFMWRNNATALSVFSGNIMGIQSSGYGAAAVIPENQSIILLLTWADEKDAVFAKPYMESLIDSLYVDIESYFSAGVLTTFTFPKEGTQDIRLEIDGKEISTSLDKSDKKAADYLIDREYKVLLMYQKSDLWKEAWQRYYRMIFRDSSERLLQAGFDISNALAPDCKDSTELAQKLLTWTQSFKYEREKTSSDFASLPAILLGSGSDCDSRSMLIAVLLQGMNIDSMIFVSAEYKHAIAGLVSEHPGFGFDVNGKLYLTGETTAKNITWGKIDSSQSDSTKWIPVELP